MERLNEEIQKILHEIEQHKEDKKVLVMHPSAILLVSDRITKYSNITETRVSYLFDNKFQVYPSNKLAINSCSFMTRQEYSIFSKD